MLQVAGQTQTNYSSYKKVDLPLSGTVNNEPVSAKLQGAQAVG